MTWPGTVFLTFKTMAATQSSRSASRNSCARARLCRSIIRISISTWATTTKKVCSYCSTLYRYNAKLHAGPDGSGRLHVQCKGGLSGKRSRHEQPTKPVVIAGAGIAGLTAALSFARKGIPTEIFERTAVLSEAGAGLQLSPNATRILTKLGLLRSCKTCGANRRRSPSSAASSLRTIAAVPSGQFARNRWKSPYGVLHRADLQRALLDAVTANPLCTLRLGSAVDDTAQHPNRHG